MVNSYAQEAFASLKIVYFSVLISAVNAMLAIIASRPSPHFPHGG